MIRICPRQNNFDLMQMELRAIAINLGYNVFVKIINCIFKIIIFLQMVKCICPRQNNFGLGQMELPAGAVNSRYPANLAEYWESRLTASFMELAQGSGISKYHKIYPFSQNIQTFINIQNMSTHVLQILIVLIKINFQEARLVTLLVVSMVDLLRHAYFPLSAPTLSYL